MRKQLILVLLTLLFSNIVLAKVPSVNQYRVSLRPFALEPLPQQYTISAKDQNFLVKPTILFYTQLNPLAPKAIYTIPPYGNASELPAVGKWMVHMAVNAIPYYKRKKVNKLSGNAITNTPAHWINLVNAKGQYIIEPIDYLLVVYANDKTKAITLLTKKLNSVGFSSNNARLHGAGYYAYINGKTYPQISNQKGFVLDFSNAAATTAQNDHLRVMGPEIVLIHGRQAFLFVGSVSEESGTMFAPTPKQAKALMKQHPNKYWHMSIGHAYVSFAHARSNLAVALIQKGYPTYYLVGSNVLNTIGLSTGDYDGKVFVTVMK